MTTDDRSILVKLRELVECLQRGEPAEPVACDRAAADPAVSALCREMNRLTVLHGETIPFIRALACGNLDCAPPPHNLLASPFKQLHAALLHLTWQAGQIAAGDYSQRVSFMGEFSTTFNAMIEALAEKRRVEEALQESEERHKLVIEGSNDGFWDWNVTTGTVAFSRRCAEMLGYNPNELESSVTARQRLIHPEDRPRVRKSVDNHLNGAADAYEVEFRMRTKTGDWEWVLDRGRVVARGDDNIPLRMAGTTSIITQRKRYEDDLNYLSTHDALTGLFNRAYFDAELGRLERSRHYPVSIVIADIDGLKLVNDGFGHREGDRLITLAARALRESFRPEDVVARIGGDEFAVLLPDTEADTLKEAVKRVLKCQAAINEENHDYTLSISIGSATAEQTGQFRDALHLADSRMYYYKFRRKSQHK